MMEAHHAEVKERLCVVQSRHLWATTAGTTPRPAGQCEAQIIQRKSHVVEEMAQREVVRDGEEGPILTDLDDELVLDKVVRPIGKSLISTHCELEDLVDIPVSHEGDVNGAHERHDGGGDHFERT